MVASEFSWSFWGSFPFDEVVVEFEHGSYVLLMTSGGEGKHCAVYAVFVGFLNCYRGVIDFFPSPWLSFVSFLSKAFPKSVK